MVGYARSGTTLLTVLLDRHPDLAATPETHYFDLVLTDPCRPRRGDHTSMVRHLLTHARAADLRLDPDETLARFRRHDPRWRHLFRVALERYAEVRGASRVVEKTPAHLAHVPRILQWYPDARVVLVLRDGRDAVTSMLAADFTHDDLRRHACNWRRAAELGEELASRYPGSLHTVRYEDLVANPRDALSRLHEFLGIPLDPKQLVSGEAPNVVPGWESPWKARAIAPIDPSRVGSWRHRATHAQRWAMNAIMGDVLNRLGYDDTALYDAPLPSRLRHLAFARLWRTALHPSVRPLTASAWRALRAGARR